jgi:hypothetical protein
VVGNECGRVCSFGLSIRLLKQTCTSNKKRNCAGQRGFSPIHKCTIVIKMLAYGSIADSLDDHLEVGESTVLETLKHFVRTIVDVFGEEWIRPPSELELQHILKVMRQEGFLE